MFCDTCLTTKACSNPFTEGPYIKRWDPHFQWLGPSHNQSWVPRTPKHSTWCKTLGFGQTKVPTVFRKGKSNIPIIPQLEGIWLKMAGAYSLRILILQSKSVFIWCIEDIDGIFQPCPLRCLDWQGPSFLASMCKYFKTATQKFFRPLDKSV